MSQSFINSVIDDIRSIYNAEFSQELKITPRGGEETVINGTTAFISIEFNEEGDKVLDDNASCSFFEKDLNDAGVVTRDSENKLIVKGWAVKFLDGNLIENTFKFSEEMPDKGLGIISFKLSLKE